MKKSALVIVACVVVNMVLGMAWYGVFSQPWMNANLLTMEKIEGLFTGAGIGLIALLGTIVGNWYAMRPLVVSLVDGGFAFAQYAAFCAIIGKVYAPADTV